MDAIPLRTAAALAVAVSSASGCCGAGWQESEIIDLGVSQDLYAAAPLFGEGGEHSYTGLAVGAGGTVVAMGWDDYVGSDRFIEVSVVGSADLRGAWAEPWNWWVVGDSGVVVVSGDLGQTWMTVDVGTTANLHAITSVGSQLVVAGDEVVLAQTVDGNWIEPTVPESGWGQLRALHYDQTRLYAVGHGGTIWSTSNPDGEWIAESAGTTADLLAVHHIWYRKQDLVAAVGTGGTLLVRESSGWHEIANQENVDLIDYNDQFALGANGELFEVSSRGKLSPLDVFPGARALGGPKWAVGDGGSMFSKPQLKCAR